MSGRSPVTRPALAQVEYAMEAINLAGSTVGVLAEDGVILAGEKKTTSKLLDQVGSVRLQVVGWYVGWLVGWLGCCWLVGWVHVGWVPVGFSFSYC